MKQSLSFIPAQTYLTDVNDFSIMPQAMRERLSVLTPRERKYFQIMWPKSGVLYIKSKPGVAKSAMAREIAFKMGFNYMDIRLSMIDETDMGLFPNPTEVEINGNKVKCLDFMVPRWAIEANQRPTIIHFEELNRAQLPVRNAALQILLERQIGTEFKFNDTVLMMASGNLGDEDGTDVEEFDNALNNRLIHVAHSLNANEWMDGFATENCHSLIASYISVYPERLYQNPTENTSAYATPRTWTFLSDYITKNFGKNASPSEFLPYLTEVAYSYIGNGAQRFLQYCEEMVNITIHDILDRFEQVEKELEKYNRDKNTELIHSLKQMDFLSLTEKQLRNLTKFLDRISDEERVAYILFLLDPPNSIDVSIPKVKEFMLNYRELLVNTLRVTQLNHQKKK